MEDINIPMTREQYYKLQKFGVLQRAIKSRDLTISLLRTEVIKLQRELSNFKMLQGTTIPEGDPVELMIHINSAVSLFYPCSLELVKSPTRKREIVVPRQLCHYFMLAYSKRTLTEVAFLYHRHHATVLHSKQTVIDLVDIDRVYRSNFEKIKQQLEFIIFCDNP